MENFTNEFNKKQELDFSQEFYKLSPYDITKTLKTFGFDKVIELLTSEEFMLKTKLTAYNVEEIIENLPNKEKIDFLSNKELVSNIKYGYYKSEKDEEGNYNYIFEKAETLDQNKSIIANLIKKLECSDDEKIKFADEYGIDGYLLEKIVKEGLSENKIVDIILNGFRGIDNRGQINLIRALSNEKILKLCNENFDKLLEIGGTTLYTTIGYLDLEKITYLFSRIDELNIDESIKRKLIGAMSKDNSQQIDIEVLPERLRPIAKLDREYTIKYDDEIDFSVYKDLDEFIYVNPITFNQEQKKKFIEFLKICPNTRIVDDLRISNSTSKEYISAEKWIEDVLSNVNPSWTKIQKIAYVDNQIGRKISYSPDYGTEVFNESDARALWKIIVSGYGVCNGIAQLEKYMLDKLDIESELISSKRHSFLKIKNLDIQTDDGIKHGNTILDPTWNLAAQKYGARPNNFLLSYEDIRKHDIEKEKDRQSHKNDDKLSDCTLSISDTSLRETYKSLGLTNNETTQFIIQKLIMAINQEDKSLSLEKRLDRRFELLKMYRPDFAKFIDSTIFILPRVVIPEKDLEYDKAVVDKVYKRDDENKSTVLYTYIKDGQKEYFYVAEQNSKEFCKMNRKEFEKNYKMYEFDLKRTDGKNRWDIEDKKEIDMNNISGTGDVKAARENSRGDR